MKYQGIESGNEEEEPTDDKTRERKEEETASEANMLNMRRRG